MNWAICTSSAGARRRVEKRGRFDVGEKLVIPQEKVIELVQEMQKKMNMKAGFKNTGFVPNWANWIVSQRDREVKPVLLVKALQEEAKEGLEIYDFFEVMACMERQMKGALNGNYRNLNLLLMREDEYIRQSMNEKVFDDLEKKRNGEKKEEKEEEVKKKEEEEEVKREEEVKKEEEEEEIKEVKEEVKEEEIKEVTVESLLVFVKWMVDA